ncbi:cytochrome P450 [Nannocystis pusilla]|uniref:cytochrome P450 n=1 Tax=Nannocystis pusilla TaxID=889268 RepID=UPI003B7C47CD
MSSGDGAEKDDIRWLGLRVLGTIFGAHTNTAMSVASTLSDLVEHPEALARVRAEIAALPADAPMDLTAMRTLVHLHRAINESMRLRSNGGLWRMAMCDLDLGGYKLPKGTVVGASMGLVNLDPARYDGSHDYRPARFEAMATDNYQSPSVGSTPLQSAPSAPAATCARAGRSPTRCWPRSSCRCCATTNGRSSPGRVGGSRCSPAACRARSAASPCAIVGASRRPALDRARGRDTVVAGMRTARSLLLLLASAACARPAQSGTAAPANPPNAPPDYTTARTGDVHDFDYFAGGWTTVQRRLKTRGIGSDEWEEFPATLCMTPYLGGMATVDELYFPTKGWAGLTLRTFDLQKKQWSIYWVSSETGLLGTPVVGGFEGDRGEFYGPDEDAGRPVAVRYRWTRLDADHARWEQAFSYDGGAWETNWTADFTRTDPASVCEAGRPKRQ